MCLSPAPTPTPPAAFQHPGYGRGLCRPVRTGGLQGSGFGGCRIQGVGRSMACKERATQPAGCGACPWRLLSEPLSASPGVQRALALPTCGVLAAPWPCPCPCWPGASVAAETARLTRSMHACKQACPRSAHLHVCPSACRLRSRLQTLAWRASSRRRRGRSATTASWSPFGTGGWRGGAALGGATDAAFEARWWGGAWLWGRVPHACTHRHAHPRPSSKSTARMSAHRIQKASGLAAPP